MKNHCLPFRRSRFYPAAPDKTTYMAGCSDATLGSSHCPLKDDPDQQLLGLAARACMVTTGGVFLWNQCPGPTPKPALSAPGACACLVTTDG